MNILSIDVGMKYLGFCLFHVSNGDFSITKWDTINLCNEEKHICQGMTKKKGKCNKLAKYCKNGNYYCKTHAKNQEFKIPTAELNRKKLSKKKFAVIKILCEKYNIDTKNYKYKKDYLKCIEEELDNSFFDLVQKTDARQIKLIEYGNNLRDKFNVLLKDININILAIENQIGPLALRMKTLQGMIMQHFIEKKIKDIIEISPYNKLKKYISNKKTTYAERKKLSIIETRKYISEKNSLNKWIELFEKHSKKDDLADAFLQGIYYLESTKIINY
jgi:hypothetical protein|uniref:Mitochondrial resolvase Ydc2 catalytic domain-containing protein n=1 Tax=viral metagenome TaxID=1070528 RepID=A0A6C0BXY8_9ZZZZ